MIHLKRGCLNKKQKVFSEPLLKVGDTVYQTDGVKIYENTIRRIIYDTDGVAFDESAIGKSIYLTKEAVNHALTRKKCKHMKDNRLCGKNPACTSSGMCKGHCSHFECV